MHQWIDRLDSLNVPFEQCSTLALWNNMSNAWDECRDGSTLMWLARALASSDTALLGRLDSVLTSMTAHIDKKSQADGHERARHEIYKAAGHNYNVRPWAFPFGYDETVALERTRLLEESADAFRVALHDIEDLTPKTQPTRLDFLGNYSRLIGNLLTPLIGVSKNIETLDNVLDVRWKDANLSADLWLWQLRRTVSMISERTGFQLAPIEPSLTTDGAQSTSVDVMLTGARPIPIGNLSLRTLPYGGLEMSFLGLKILPGQVAEKFAQHVSNHVGERKSEINR